MVVHQAYVLLILVVHQPSIVAPSWSRQSSAQEEVRVNVRRLPVGSASRSSWKEDAVGGRKTQRVAALHSHSLLRSAGVGTRIQCVDLNHTITRDTRRVKSEAPLLNEVRAIAQLGTKVKRR